MAVFMTLPKLAMVSPFIRLLGNFGCTHGQASEYISLLLSVLAVCSLVVGMFGALSSMRVRTILAYSAVANTGYFLVALINGSLGALVYYLFAYAIALVTVFLALSIIEYIARQDIVDITDLAGLRVSNPLLAWGFAISLFSMAGLPPFLGFCGKVAVFWCSHFWFCIREFSAYFSAFVVLFR